MGDERLGRSVVEHALEGLEIAAPVLVQGLAGSLVLQLLTPGHHQGQARLPPVPGHLKRDPGTRPGRAADPIPSDLKVGRGAPLMDEAAGLYGLAIITFVLKDNPAALARLNPRLVDQPPTQPLGCGERVPDVAR